MEAPGRPIGSISRFPCRLVPGRQQPEHRCQPAAPAPKTDTRSPSASQWLAPRLVPTNNFVYIEPLEWCLPARYKVRAGMFDNEKTEKIKVLVVDDSLLIRVAARKMLGDRFDVVLAEDGMDGWRTIESEPGIQVVFTDLVMPELDGFELLKKIRTSDREHIRDLPVIVTTGADNPEIAKQKAIGLGATDFVTKPFDATAITTRALSYANLHKTTESLKEQTTVDVLTGHMNGKGFSRQLEKEIAFVIRHQSLMSVMAIELDGFKDLFIRVGRRGAETIELNEGLFNECRRRLDVLEGAKTLEVTGVVIRRFSPSRPSRVSGSSP